MGDYLLGIDAGTTALKAVLYNEHGHAVGSATEEYRLLTPEPDYVELDARAYWDACARCLRRIMDSTEVSGDRVKALAISSQGETCVPVDDHGEPLRNAMVWLDNRASAQAENVKDRFGVERVYHTSGSHEIVPCWGGIKMMWIKENEPEIFDKAAKLLLVEDFLIHKLTGRFIGETALYCSTLMMDITSGTWWDEFLAFAGIPREKLVDLLAPGEIVGPLTAEAAKATGLSPSTMVVTGGMDQACGSVGSGNITPGRVTETTGASLNICATTTRPVFDPEYRMPCQVHAVQDAYILLPWCQTAGMTLKWFRDAFCEIELSNAARRGKDSYDLMTAQVATVPPGSDGLIMLPHLAGSMCPKSNPRAQGVFFGVTLGTTKGHFIRAIMESIAFMLRENLDAMAELGIVSDSIISLGGASRSRLWTQIKADVLGKPVTILADPETACLGAAILAGKATGVFASIEEACASMVSAKRTVRPNPARREVYDRNYETYRKLYASVEPLF